MINYNVFESDRRPETARPPKQTANPRTLVVSPLSAKFLSARLYTAKPKRPTRSLPEEKDSGPKATPVTVAAQGQSPDQPTETADATRLVAQVWFFHWVDVANKARDAPHDASDQTPPEHAQSVHIRQNRHFQTLD